MADIDIQLSDREGVFSWPCRLQCVLNCTLDEICFFRLASPSSINLPPQSASR